MMLDGYIAYIGGIRRYSPRTCEVYRAVLEEYVAFAGGEEIPDRQTVRAYEVHLLDERGESARTVNLHLSVLSGYCRYLLKQGVLQSNPVHLVKRPKEDKRLVEFYRSESMQEYFENSRGVPEFGDYAASLRHLVISLLFGTGIRRSELIALNRNSVDLGRRVMHVMGKGNKMREIPLTSSVCDEISLYLQKLDSLKCADVRPDAALLQTERGGRLYPVFVDRAVKKELGGVAGISGRKSPHVLRHTLATELLDNGADLNSIKELLGHSSLAATQVYTHNSIERLKNVYNNAHPRAKNGGNMEIKVKSLKFDAGERLTAFVEKKVSRLSKFFDGVAQEAEVVLEDTKDGKRAKIQIRIPGDSLIIDRAADTFENAITECVDAMKEKLTRAKEKKYEK